MYVICEPVQILILDFIEAFAGCSATTKLCTRSLCTSDNDFQSCELKTTDDVVVDANVSIAGLSELKNRRRAFGCIFGEEIAYDNTL